MNKNRKIQTILIICSLSLSLFVIGVPVRAYNRSAWIEKSSEYMWFYWWLPGWALSLYVTTQRTYEQNCGHYYFSSDAEEYAANPSIGFSWTKYSEVVEYVKCPMCREVYSITYQVHGRFYYTTDTSNYYDITLTIEYFADDIIDPTFGPFINHLKGTWRFEED